MDLNAFLDTAIGNGNDGSVSLEGMLQMEPFLAEQPKQVISNEGFMDFIKNVYDKIFNGKPSVRDMTGGWFQRTSVIRETINKTYLNPEWLDKRHFNDRPFSDNKFIKAISINSIWDYDGLVSGLDACVQTYNGITKAYKDSIKAALTGLNHNAQNIEFNIDRITYNDLRQMDRMFKEEIPKLGYSYKLAVGGAEVTRSESKLNDTGVVSIEYGSPRYGEVKPLVKEQVIALANKVIALTDVLYTFGKIIESYYDDPMVEKLEKVIDELQEAADTPLPNSGDMVKDVGEAASRIDPALAEEAVKVYAELLPFDPSCFTPHFNHVRSIIQSLAMVIDGSVK